MGAFGRGLLVGLGALGAYGLAAAAVSSNDTRVPDADDAAARDAAAAPGFLIGGNWADAPAAIVQSMLNPIHAIAFLGGVLAQKVTGSLAANPHIYLEEYASSSPQWLLDGYRP